MTDEMTNTTFTPQEYLLNGRRAFSVWAVIENWAVNEEGGHNELLYGSREDAARVFQSQLSIEANEGCIADWSGREDFCFERSTSSYECWLDGDYNGNHYEIVLEEKPVILGDATYCKKQSGKNERP